MEQTKPNFINSLPDEIEMENIFENPESINNDKKQEIEKEFATKRQYFLKAE
jgi:hypothetical protein